MSAVTGLVPADVSGLEDDELVRLAREGDEAAFDAIVNRYRLPLVNYCRRWLDPHRAEEVVQHTFMKAFLCLRDDDRPLALRPWLYRVAHNASLNALEKKGSDWEELDENYDGVPQPPQVAEQRARFLEVVGEIEALPVRQREALVLNEFEGRCYAEIADELGTSESGVRGLLRRARRQLREAAAAVLLPFPALRELVRTDEGRSLQPDRAAEIVATAGTAGGVGAASGFAKVAAGVLAAGTIAGGGTAIEQGRDELKVPAAEAQAAAPTTAERVSRGQPQRVVSLVGDEVSFATRRSLGGPDASVMPEDPASSRLGNGSGGSAETFRGAPAPPPQDGTLEQELEPEAPADEPLLGLEPHDDGDGHDIGLGDGQDGEDQLDEPEGDAPPADEEPADDGERGEGEKPDGDKADGEPSTSDPLPLGGR